VNAVAVRVHYLCNIETKQTEVEGLIGQHKYTDPITYKVTQTDCPHRKWRQNTLPWYHHILKQNSTI